MPLRRWSLVRSAESSTVAAQFVGLCVGISSACAASIQTEQVPLPPARCEAEFGLLNKSSQQLQNLVPNTLLHIRSALDSTLGDSVGTAFLVSRELGLFVTAGHVVRDAIGLDQKDARDFPIRGITRNGQEIGLNVHQFLCTAESCTGQLNDKNTGREDFALLQANPTDLRHLRGHLEVRFPLPDWQTDGLYFMGFGSSPTGQSNPRPNVAPESAFTITRQYDHIYEAEKSVTGGDSGAPVFSNKGEVYGIVIEGSGSIAQIHGIKHYIAHLLDAHLDLQTKKPKKLRDYIFEENEYKDEHQIREILYNSREIYTNIEIALLYKEHGDEIRRLKGRMFDCIVKNIGEQRRLSPYASRVIQESTLQGLRDSNAAELINGTTSLRRSRRLREAQIVNQFARRVASDEIAAILGGSDGQRALAGSVARNQRPQIVDRQQVVATSYTSLEPMDGITADEAIVPLKRELESILDGAVLEASLSHIAERPIGAFETYTSERLALAMQHYARTVLQEIELVSLSEVAPDGSFEGLADYRELIRNGLNAVIIGRGVARDRDTIALMEDTRSALERVYDSATFEYKERYKPSIIPGIWSQANAQAKQAVPQNPWWLWN